MRIKLPYVSGSGFDISFGNPVNPVQSRIKIFLDKNIFLFHIFYTGKKNYLNQGTEYVLSNKLSIQRNFPCINKQCIIAEKIIFVPKNYYYLLRSGDVITPTILRRNKYSFQYTLLAGIHSHVIKLRYLVRQSISEAVCLIFNFLPPFLDKTKRKGLGLLLFSISE